MGITTGATTEAPMPIANPPKIFPFQLSKSAIIHLWFEVYPAKTGQLRFFVYTIH
jgi:hypothetical protein